MNAHVHRMAGGLALFAGAAIGTAAHADDPCVPEWDVTLGNPGMNDLVAAFVAYDDGQGDGEQLYVTGSFTSAGGAPLSQRIAKWNGATWEGVGGGLQNQYSNTLGTYDGDLIVGGYFDFAGGVPGTAKLARWDGTTWNSMGGQLESFLSSVWGLKTWDDGNGEDLYVFGNYVSIGGTGVNHIVRWDGTEYTSIGGGTIAGPGIPLIVFDGEVFDDGSGEALYISGRFSSVDDVPANRIAKWDGVEWTGLGSGITGGSAGTGAHSMEVWDDGTGPALFVTGQSFDTAGGVAVSNIAKWDGTQWHTLGTGLDGTGWDLRVYDDGSGPALYVVGTFTQAGGTPASRIARWDGAEWSAVDEGVSDSVFGAIVFDEKLIVGGKFTEAGGLPTERVAAYVGCPSTVLGDLTGDGCVDQADLGLLLSSYGVDDGGDLDGDGDTDQADLGLMLSNWGAGC